MQNLCDTDTDSMENSSRFAFPVSQQMAFVLHALWKGNEHVQHVINAGSVITAVPAESRPKSRCHT